MRLTLSILACAISLSSVAQAAPTQNDGNGEAKKNASQSAIQKRPKQQNEFNDYSSVHDKVYKPKSYVNHDDSVQKRASGTPPNLGSGNQKPDNSLKPINCTHPAYKSLCAEIKKSVGNGGSSGGSTPTPPKWHTVYNGGGTRSLNPRDGYVTFKVWYKWSQSINGRSYYGMENKTGYSTGTIGKRINVSRTVSASSSRKCGGDRRTATATATATLSFVVGNTVTAPASAYKKETQYNCATATSEAKIQNFVITRLDIYY